MKNYEAPKVTELGTVGDLTRGTGDEHAWDSEYGIFGFVGIIVGNGGSPSGSNG